MPTKLLPRVALRLKLGPYFLTRTSLVFHSDELINESKAILFADWEVRLWIRMF